ncbi:MAG: glycosyltransferase family 2 protein [bacterium]|nr:glycosyltransferase family 2 protein [bacterium]
MIGVVVVTHNSAKYLQTCLSSLYDNLKLLEESSMVVVVDNASRDDGVAFVHQFFSRAQLIENKENVGFSRAVNQGAQVCFKKGCEELLILNPDTKVERGALAEMLKVLRAGEKRAIVQPLLTRMSDPRLVSSWGNEYRGLGLVLCGGGGVSIENAKRKTKNNKLRDRQIGFASGACMLIRSEVWKKLKGFDERYFLYFEDSDFCRRVRQAFLEVWLAPQARVQHDHYWSLSPRKWWWRLRGWMRFIPSPSSSV